MSRFLRVCVILPFIVLYPMLHLGIVEVDVPVKDEECTMETCFDFERCREFRVYVYPDSTPQTELFASMLRIIRGLRYDQSLISRV